MRNKKLIKLEVSVYSGVARNLEDTKVPHIELSMGEVIFFNFAYGNSPYKASEEFAKKIKDIYLPDSLNSLDIYTWCNGIEHWFEHWFTQTYEHDYYSGEVEASSAEEAREEMIANISSAKMVSSYTNEYYEGEVLASSPEEALEEMLHDIYSLDAVEVTNE